jgi:hypothetical protein
MRLENATRGGVAGAAPRPGSAFSGQPPGSPADASGS